MGSLLKLIESPRTIKKLIRVKKKKSSVDFFFGGGNLLKVDLKESFVFKCEFPGCGKEYGKRQHLKEHFR